MAAVVFKHPHRNLGHGKYFGYFLRGACYGIAESFKRNRKLVQLDNIGLFKVNTPGGVALLEACHQRVDGGGDHFANHQHTRHTQEQRKNERNISERFDFIGKLHQVVLLNHANDGPLVVVKRRVQLIEVKRIDGADYLFTAVVINHVDVMTVGHICNRDGFCIAKTVFKKRSAGGYPAVGLPAV
ncbi:hypothetical protein DSECCO2_554990 [anaerobic digester metagenome]